MIPVAKFIVLDKGDNVDYGIWLSYRLIRDLCQIDFFNKIEKFFFLVCPFKCSVIHYNAQENLPLLGKLLQPRYTFRKLVDLLGERREKDLCKKIKKSF